MGRDSSSCGHCARKGLLLVTDATGRLRGVERVGHHILQNLQEILGNEPLGALDAVMTFFENTEPSSPVPLFIERAKRLIAKNFLDVLQDIVPDALNAAKAAGGIRDKK